MNLWLIQRIFQGNHAVLNHGSSSLGFEPGQRMWLSSEDWRKSILILVASSFIEKCRIPVIPSLTMYKSPLTHTSAIPHFKEVIVMATNCDACGERTNEVKSGGKLSLNDLQSHVASYSGGPSFSGIFSRAFRLTRRLIFVSRVIYVIVPVFCTWSSLWGVYDLTGSRRGWGVEE